MVTQQDIDFMIRDMDKRKADLSKTMKEFEALQAEIKDLEQQAGKNPAAARKMDNLRRTFPNGFNDFNAAILPTINTINAKLLDVKKQMTKMGNKPKSSELALAQAIKMPRKRKKSNNHNKFA